MRATDREQARWLASLLRPHGASIAALLALSLGTSALVMVQPWLTKLLIDDGLLARDTQALVAIALAMFGVGLAASLFGVAATVKVVVLPGPDKSDASDYLDNGGAADDLLQLVAECTEWEPEQQPASTETGGGHRLTDIGNGERPSNEPMCWMTSAKASCSRSSATASRRTSRRSRV